MTSRDLLTQKLDLLRRLWKAHRKTLTEDQELKHLLISHQRAFEKAQKVMKETGGEAFCARCGREKRSCCGEDMEFHCDDRLLLANLLCGVELPSQRIFENGCYFLGKEGCLLRIRPLICRNFICPELAAFLGTKKIALIQHSLEEEARALFFLEERISCLLAK